MNTYEVTYLNYSPSFKNTEIEVDDADAAKIRTALTESLRMRQPLVFGRDWDYTPVKVRETVRIEADGYSIETGGVTAHFYEKYETNTERGSRLIGSVLNVIKVQEVPATS